MTFHQVQFILFDFFELRIQYNGLKCDLLNIRLSSKNMPPLFEHSCQVKFLFYFLFLIFNCWTQSDMVIFQIMDEV